MVVKQEKQHKTEKNKRPHIPQQTQINIREKQQTKKKGKTTKKAPTFKTFLNVLKL